MVLFKRQNVPAVLGSLYSKAPSIEYVSIKRNQLRNSFNIQWLVKSREVGLSLEALKSIRESPEMHITDNYYVLGMVHYTEWDWSSLKERV